MTIFRSKHRFSYVIDNRFGFDVNNDCLAELEAPQRCIRLQPTAARILCVLLQEPGAVILRRDLLGRGWTQYGFVVSEGSLNQTIHLLRHAFAQLDPTRTYIRTVPRIGYSLIACVSDATPAMHEPAMPAMPHFIFAQPVAQGGGTGGDAAVLGQGGGPGAVVWGS